MSVFNHYARYYDLLYKDKNYIGEAEYVHGLLQRFGGKTGSILELGCGTGKHAILLSEKGYTITGVDLSEEMLVMARDRATKAAAKIDFYYGDVRGVRLKKEYDAVISLFHVMSYHVSNNDLDDAFSTAKVHLKKGGVFVFDFWYGPTVMTDRPVVRVKRLEDDAIEVTRIAEPVLFPNENVVDVNYAVFIRDKKSGAMDEVREKHRMRYLFKPEIVASLDKHGMELIAEEEWMTGKTPGVDTWGVVYVVRNKS